MSSVSEPLQLMPADEYEADEAIARLSALSEELRGAVHDRTRSGVRLDLGFRGQRFVAPWKRAEVFFRQGSGVAPLEVDDPDLQRFMAQWATSRLCYGYPCYVNANGHVLPLLFCDVRLRIAPGGQVQVELDRHSKPQVNQRVLIDHGFDRSLTDELTVDLVRRDFENFDACLSHVAGLLGLQDILFAAEHLNPWPLEDRTEGWRNTPILFAPVEDPGQAGIADELLAIETTIRQASRHTALHAFFDQKPGSLDHRVPPLAPFTAGTGREPVLETCLDNTLTYLTAPPGTGRLPFMGNLIASQIAAGGSVLFVSSHGHVIDQVTGQLEAALQRSGTWIHRLEQRAGTDVLVKTLEDHAGQQSNVHPLPDGPMEAGPSGIGHEHLGEVEKRLDALRHAQWRLSVARTEATAVRDGIARQWWPLLDAGTDLAIDRETAEKLVERAGKLGEPAKRQGFKKLLGRPDEQRAYDEVARDLIGAMGPLPLAVTGPLEGVLADASQARDAAPLAASAQAVAATFPWRQAVQRADEAAVDIAKSPDITTLIRHFSAAQAVVKKAARGILSDRWNSRIDRKIVEAGEKMRGFQTMQADRRSRGMADDWLDRKTVQAMRDAFAAVPLWTGRVENVLARLPLEPALFDLVVIEDAQSIDAGALFPLLFRARQAVVVATRAPAAHHRSTAAGLMRTTKGAGSAMLRECARGHPHITRALSLSAHAGKLRSVGNTAQLTAGVDASLAGVHWHPANATGDFLLDSQLDGVLTLIKSWREAGLFEMNPAKVIGIACPGPGRRAALMGALGKLLPQPLVLERIAVAGPERFHSQVVDFLIAVPLQDGEPKTVRADRLASSALMYHDAIAAARIGVHLVGDRLRAQTDGSLIGALAAWENITSVEGAMDAGVEEGIARLAPLLEQAGICFTRTPRGLLAFGQLGSLYEFVVPGGRQNGDAMKLTDDAVTFDLMEEDLADPSRQLSTLLARLC